MTEAEKTKKEAEKAKKEAEKAKKETQEVLTLFKGKNADSNKLELLEIMSTNWNTTLDKIKLEVLLNMYATRDYDPDSNKFNEEIANMDAERDIIFEDKAVAVYDKDSAIICRVGPKDDARTSCSSPHNKELSEEIIELNEIEVFYSRFENDVNNGGINTVTWDDISEAIENDEKLTSIRNALRNGDKNTVNKELTGIKISDNWADPTEIVKLSSLVKLEDLSLYKNCLMVRDRIWVPEDLRRNFFNNLLLGHRGVGIMMRLALRSAYWINMKSDLQHYYNDCGTCIQSQEKNKKQERLPEEEVHFLFQQLTMDIGKTPAREHILAITDRYTGYVWAAKTGDSETGTAGKCIDILKSCIGTGLLTTEKIKCDEGSNLIAREMTEFLEPKGIAIDTSSAYNPAGNLLAENGIRRVKRAIGVDAWDDIQALNQSSPYSNETQSPFEAMYGFQTAVFGLPQPEYLKKQKIAGDNLQTRRNRKSDRNVKPYGCKSQDESNFDRDSQTMKERLIVDYWMEKIHKSDHATMLEPGDNIYYRDPTIKGFGRWKPRVIIDRKGEVTQNGDIIRLKGYNILDTITGRHTTRTRNDIRIKKKSKLEEKIYKEYIQFLNRMHEADNADKGNEHYQKPLFNEEYKPAADGRGDQSPIIPTARDAEKPIETPTEAMNPIGQEPTTTPEATEETPAPETERKMGREERNLKSELGDYWKCTDHDPHFDGPIARRLRVRTTNLKIDEEESGPTQEDFWTLENDMDPYFTKWKKAYKQIHESIRKSL